MFDLKKEWGDVGRLPGYIPLCPPKFHALWNQVEALSAMGFEETEVPLLQISDLRVNCEIPCGAS